ncbi:protein phosphatase 2C domain-containing protein [Amycolatopsis decaplanina]|uniref:protein phosphatase 2C domain-containing protein n=1 Tax=Amycolatopsis decaplanina TaxID=208441 RepID=UPI000344C718|nr:protein phosphatase 2C domain-containing protein [Amycolatopsis decaplanina]
MEVVASESSGTAYWQWQEQGVQALGVWTERKAGAGEDAEPLLIHRNHAAEGLIAVFDGAGGAGSAGAGLTPDGRERTGAWVGSRTARAATEEWYVRVAEDYADLDAAGLKSLLDLRLGQMAIGNPSKLGGSMRRTLPTTLASIRYEVGDDAVRWQVFWAGDSRCYLLEESGLQQLSLDDTDSADALTLLIEDPPMTNLVSADRQFVVNSAHGGARTPCVLLCATDGFFGYVRGPADFEYFLLRSLSTAVDLDHWASNLIETVCSYTGDDASLSLVALGFRDFEDLRGQYAARLGLVRAEFWEPLRAAEAGTDRECFVAARKGSWERYRSGYERRMPFKEEDR